MKEVVLEPSRQPLFPAEPQVGRKVEYRLKNCAVNNLNKYRIGEKQPGPLWGWTNCPNCKAKAPLEIAEEYKHLDKFDPWIQIRVSRVSKAELNFRNQKILKKTSDL